jgi:dihydroflavonol-4-reductase
MPRLTTTVAVTGAAGHLGANLVPELLGAGYRVRCLVHRSRAGLGREAVETVPGDVLDPASLRRAFTGCEVVFHLAGAVSILGGRGGAVRRINLVGSRNVARVCRELDTRLIHCSSVQAFAPPPTGGVLTESASLDDSTRATAYAHSKALAHRCVLEEASRGLDAVVAAPTAVIGPRDYGPSRLGRLLIALARIRLPCLVEGAFDWVDARDAAQGMLAAAAKAPRGRVYLLGGHRIPLLEMARRWGAVVGVRAPRFAAPASLARAAALVGEITSGLTGREPLLTREALDALADSSVVDSGRARRELAYRPRPLEETLADTAVWFRRRGML